MIESITRINSAINNVVWGWPALILLGFVGILMTCLTKFFQISHIGHWMKNTIGAIFKDKHVTGHTKDRTISQFQSLCTALAATVGTGNIVGVAGAIAVGAGSSLTAGAKTGDYAKITETGKKFIENIKKARA